MLDQHDNLILTRYSYHVINAEGYIHDLREGGDIESGICPVEADGNLRLIESAVNNFDMLVAALMHAKNDLILAGYEPYSKEVAHIRAVIDKAEKGIECSCGCDDGIH